MSLRNQEILTAPQSSPGTDKEPRAPIPWVTGTFVALSVLFFILAHTEGNFESSLWFQTGILYGPYLREGHQWFRVFSTVLTHGNILHLFMNMSAMWALGSALEKNIGAFRMLLTSLVSAMGSAMFILAFSFRAETVGASGMILGYLGATLPMVSAQSRKKLTQWLIQIAIISILPGVSWQGHLGGFLWGLPLGWALRGGPTRFSWAAPLLVSVCAAGLLWVGKGFLL